MSFAPTHQRLLNSARIGMRRRRSNGIHWRFCRAHASRRNWYDSVASVVDSGWGDTMGEEYKNLKLEYSVLSAQL